LIVWLLAVAVVIGPAVAAVIDRGGTGVPVVTLPTIVPGPGCTTSGEQTATWSGQGNGMRSGVQHFTCAGFSLTTTIDVFPVRANPALPIAVRRSTGAEDLSEDVAVSPFTAVQVPWQLVETQQPDHVAASALWIDGDPALGGIAGRLRQARNSLFGGDFAPVMVMVSLDGDGSPIGLRQRQQAGTVIRAFVDAQGGLNERIVALARAAAH